MALKGVHSYVYIRPRVGASVVMALKGVHSHVYIRPRVGVATSDTEALQCVSVAP